MSTTEPAEALNRTRGEPTKYEDDQFTWSLEQADASRALRERMTLQSAPTTMETLGFDLRVHQQRSGKDLQDYFDEDPSAPRYPTFVLDALDRIDRTCRDD